MNLDLQEHTWGLEELMMKDFSNFVIACNDQSFRQRSCVIINIFLSLIRNYVSICVQFASSVLWFIFMPSIVQVFWKAFPFTYILYFLLERCIAHIGECCRKLSHLADILPLMMLLLLLLLLMLKCRLLKDETIYS